MAFAATASKRGAFADMNKAAIDVAQALARLSELTIFELRGEWRRLHRMPPPMRLSRDLLVRGITYKLHPEIVRALLVGSQSNALTPSQLLRLSKNLPHDWKEQRRFLGFAA